MAHGGLLLGNVAYGLGQSGIGLGLAKERGSVRRGDAKTDGVEPFRGDDLRRGFGAVVGLPAVPSIAYRASDGGPREDCRSVVEYVTPRAPRRNGQATAALIGLPRAPTAER